MTETPGASQADDRALEELRDWIEYWKLRAEERDDLVARLKDHAAGQAGEIEEIKDELLDAYRDLAGLQGRILGG